MKNSHFAAQTSIEDMMVDIIATSLHQQGFEVTLEETKHYLPEKWYEMTPEEIEFCVFLKYCTVESLKEAFEDLENMKHK